MSRNHCPNRTVLGILNQDGTESEATESGSSSVGRMSSGEFELGLFRIDSGNDDDVEGGRSLEVDGSQHDHDGANEDNDSKDKWRGSLPLYNTSVDVDYTEATVVAPVDLDEGSILRVDMGMRKILVVQVVSLVLSHGLSGVMRNK